MSQKKVEEEKIDTLVERGILNSFLHREKESFISLATKYVVNFIVSCIQFLNIPGFICVAIVSFNPIMGLITSDTKLPNGVIYTSLILYGTFVIVRHLHNATITNLTSRNIDLIWFINSKKNIKNWFYSVPMAEKHYTNLSDYIIKETDNYLQEQLALSNKKIKQLNEELSRINELENFPNSTFRSLELVNERLNHYCKKSRNSENVKDSMELFRDVTEVLNFILGEISNLDTFQEKVLNARFFVRSLPRYVNYICCARYRALTDEFQTLHGDDPFLSHVINKDSLVMVPDINNPDNKDWFKGWNNNDGNAIIAYPVGLNNTSTNISDEVLEHAKYGVILLQFEKGTEYNELEIMAITKVLNTYAKSINLSIQIYLNNLNVLRSTR